MDKDYPKIFAIILYISSLPSKHFIRMLSSRGKEILMSYRRYEISYYKYELKLLDLQFLRNCLNADVYPNFLSNMQLPEMLSYMEKKKIWRKGLVRKIREEETFINILRMNIFNARFYFYSISPTHIFQLGIRHCIKSFIPIVSAKRNTHEKTL